MNDNFHAVFLYIVAIESNDPVVEEMNIINVAQLLAYYKIERSGGEYTVRK